jgi:hypothetical protein
VIASGKARSTALRASADEKIAIADGA